jgi:hypothetical protein
MRVRYNQDTVSLHDLAPKKRRDFQASFDDYA